MQPVRVQQSRYVIPSPHFLLYVFVVFVVERIFHALLHVVGLGG